MRYWWKEYGQTQEEAQTSATQALIHKAEKLYQTQKNEELTEENIRAQTSPKRYLAVNAMGNLLAAAVCAADMRDTKSGILAARTSIHYILN